MNRVGHQEDTLDSADFDALEEKARATLSPAAYAFAAAGADDEITAADNIAAWRRLRFKMRSRVGNWHRRTRGMGRLADRCA